MAGGSSRSAFNVAFATDNNIADVTAKATSQTICTSLLGTSAGLAVASWIGQSAELALLWYGGFAAVHLWSGYHSARSVPLSTLNPSRLMLLAQRSLSGTVTTTGCSGGDGGAPLERTRKGALTVEKVRGMTALPTPAELAQHDIVMPLFLLSSMASSESPQAHCASSSSSIDIIAAVDNNGDTNNGDDSHHHGNNIALKKSPTTIQETHVVDILKMLRIGTPLDTLFLTHHVPTSVVEGFKEQATVYLEHDKKYILLCKPEMNEKRELLRRKQEYHLLLHEDATAHDIISSFLHIIIVHNDMTAASQQHSLSAAQQSALKQADEHLPIFLDLLHDAGWDASKNVVIESKRQRARW